MLMTHCRTLRQCSLSETLCCRKSSCFSVSVRKVHAVYFKKNTVVVTCTQLSYRSATRVHTRADTAYDLHEHRGHRGAHTPTVMRMINKRSFLKRNKRFDRMTHPGTRVIHAWSPPRPGTSSLGRDLSVRSISHGSPSSLRCSSSRATAARAEGAPYSRGCRAPQLPQRHAAVRHEAPSPHASSRSLSPHPPSP